MTTPALALLDAPRPAAATECDSAVVSETVGVCREAFGDALRAVILTGSLARGEATWARQDGERSTSSGDAEFLLLFRDGRPLPLGGDTAAVETVVEDRLRARRLFCEVTLAPCHAAYLSGLPPSIFAYELRACGRVVSGDPEALRCVPAFEIAEIPREDAWRMLCNRLVEQLAPLAEMEWTADPTPALRYRTVKLYLDMATSLLAFLGAYAPSYRGRAEALRRLAEDGGPHGLPLSLPELARKVTACTRFKLHGEGATGLESWPAWREAVRLARELWRWETATLAGAPPDASDDALRARWMSALTGPSRHRGWLYVARAEGWHRAWRRWPRWLRLAWRGSPRHCIYAAATRLLFALAASDSLPHAAPPWRELGDWLPVPSGGGALETGPRLAAEIVANYDRFLVGTRA